MFLVFGLASYDGYKFEKTDTSMEDFLKMGLILSFPVIAVVFTVKVSLCTLAINYLTVENDTEVVKTISK